MNVSPVAFEQPGQLRRFLLFGGIYVALWISTWHSARLLDSQGVVSLWFLPAGLRNTPDLTSPAHSALSALAGTVGLFHMDAITQAQGPNVLIKWMTGEFIGTITLAPLLLVRVIPGLQHYLLQGRWQGTGKTDQAGKNQVQLWNGG